MIQRKKLTEDVMTYKIKKYNNYYKILNIYIQLDLKSIIISKN